MRKLKLIFLLLFALTACKKEKLLICDIYEDTKGYSIGEITKYISGIGKVTYYYDYVVDGKSYTGKEKVYGIGQEERRLLGKNFLVVYRHSNPEESDLNKNYPIESNDEFEQLLTEFEDYPPEPDWPRNCE